MNSRYHYRADEPCTRCGDRMRYISTRACVTCAKRYMQRRRGTPIVDDLIGNITTVTKSKPASTPTQDEWSDLL